MFCISSDMVMRFGTRGDGVIGIPCIVHGGHIIEASYFYGIAKPKNIIVISSQASCPMKCSFCELGSEPFGRNLTAEEMNDQVWLLLEEAKKEGFTLANYPHKITFANSGEPLLNPATLAMIHEFQGVAVSSFKISTVLPDFKGLAQRVEKLAIASNEKLIQLQISLISTSEEERQRIAVTKVADFKTIRHIADIWRSNNPSGRKVNLSLIITGAMDCGPKKIAGIFPPALFRFRFREYVPTDNGRSNALEVVSADKLAEIKSRFADAGYEITHFASPTDTERRFSLAANVIRRIYLDITKKS